MNDRVPSLDLLLELVHRERDKQLAHLDALDDKGRDRPGVRWAAEHARRIVVETL